MNASRLTGHSTCVTVHTRSTAPPERSQAHAHRALQNKDLELRLTELMQLLDDYELQRNVCTARVACACC